MRAEFVTEEGFQLSATAVVESPMSKPVAGTTFRARREDLRLVKSPKYPITGPSGQKVGESPGETLKFGNHRLFVPTTGTITLEDGRPLDAAVAREWLESHRLHGDVEDGFWAETQVAPPVSGEELNAIVQAALRFDEERLEQVIEQERAGWGREAILDSATEALSNMREAKAAAAVEPKPAAKKPAAKQD